MIQKVVESRTELFRSKVREQLREHCSKTIISPLQKQEVQIYKETITWTIKKKTAVSNSENDLQCNLQDFIRQVKKLEDEAGKFCVRVLWHIV